MASCQFLNHPNQVRDSCSGKSSRGRSKSQMCLNKILHIITSVSPCGTLKEPSLSSRIGKFELEGKRLRDEDVGLFCCNRGFAIDFNLRLGPCLKTEGSEALAENCGLSTCRVVGKVAEKDSPAVSDGVVAVQKSSSEGECDLKGARGAYQSDSSAIVANSSVDEIVLEEKGTEVSEITNLQARSFETNNNNGVCEETEVIREESKLKQKEKEHENKGYLDLLIEAAQVIAGDFAAEDKPPEPEKPSRDGEHSSESSTHDIAETEPAMHGPARKRSKRNRSWMVADLYGDLEDISPVVRSKRGRNQVLPYRFRDSVLEPWKPLARPQKSTTGSRKRRSR